jgi:hypothetical protein
LVYSCAARLAGFLAAVDKPCDPRLIEPEHQAPPALRFAKTDANASFS